MKQRTQKLKDGSMRVIEAPLPIVASGTVLVRNFYPLISAGTEGGTAAAARAACLSRNGVSYLTRMCLDDTKHFLPDHNLTYSDNAAMPASVEGRPPLVDHRIVEFMFSLAPKYRINGWTQKYLLKKSAETLLPKKIVYRPKAPFGAPLRSWIRQDLKEMVDDILSPSSLKRHGLYNPDMVRKLIKADRDGTEDNALLIWSILTRELWFRTFIERTIGD